MIRTTRLQQIKGGRVIKQTDSSSPFSFMLQDSKGQSIDLDGQDAVISLYSTDRKRYRQTNAKVKESIVTFNFPGNLGDGEYILEIASSGYVFPADEDLIIKVTKGFEDLIGADTAEQLKMSVKDLIEAEAKKIVKDLDYTQLKGDKGDPFTYKDFTKEQLQALKGDKGDPFKYQDFTIEQLNTLKGDKGDPFKYQDFTTEQLNTLKGDPFTYKDFTKEQLEKLKGPKGDNLLYQSLTENEKSTITESVSKDVKDELQKLTEIEIPIYQAGYGLNKENNTFSISGEFEENILSKIPKEDLSEYTKKAELENYVKKVDGKDLSTNDYTNADKDKIKAIPTNPKYTDTLYVAGTGIKLDNLTFSVDSTVALKTDIPNAIDLTPYAKTSDLTSYVKTVSGKDLSTNDYTSADKVKVTAIPASPKYTDTTYTAGTGLQLTGTTFSVASTVALKTDIPSLTDYAKKTDIPSLSGYALKTDLSSYVTNQTLTTQLEGFKNNYVPELIKNVRDGSSLKTRAGTQAQYDAIATKDGNTLYYIAE